MMPGANLGLQMGKPDAPTPPDPKATAAASTATNVGTAIANSNLQNVNQVTPNGSLTYSQSGTYKWTDPNTGQSYDIPQYTATTALSPDQQKLQDLSNQTKTNLGQIGLDASSRIGGILSTPFNANKAVEDKITALGSARLDPQFQRESDALTTKLSNQGLQPGSAAWNAQMTQFGQNKNDAYNQLYLNGSNQAFQQSLAERNQPINEVTALMSGSQVSNPSFQNTNEPTIPTTDTAGIINQSYAQQQQAYQSQMQQYNQIMGGMFGLGAAGVYKYSDRRLKSSIQRIGSADNGLPLYRYMIDGKSEIGLMSDDVREFRPDAVKVMPDGFDAVDYARALEVR
jgi:hypothetical protein